MLFLIYVNHVVSNLTCMYKMFADDIPMWLCYTPDNPFTSSQVAQNDIDNFAITAVSWDLAMNVSKYKCLY